MASRPPRVSVVVPTYEERANLRPLLEGLREALADPYEVVVVDDGSPDGTARRARELARDHPVRLLERGKRLGLGSAYRDGFRLARGELVAQMDGDLSHDPATLPDLLEAATASGGLAVGSRYVDHGGTGDWSPLRRTVSRGGGVLARAMLGLGARDVTSGYRCFTRQAAHVVQLTRTDGFAFQVEALFLAAQMGIPIVEVPIIFHERRAGESKLGSAEVVHFATTVAKLGLTRL